MKDDEIANPIPTNTEPIRIGCWADGPGLCNNYVERAVNDFLASPGGWLIFNLHGFDDEGWGPISTTYYDYFAMVGCTLAREAVGKANTQSNSKLPTLAALIFKSGSL